MKELVAVQHIDKKFRNITKIEWFTTLRCNFSCSYCAEYVRSSGDETEKLLKAIDRLADGLEGRHIQLLLGGGEPSIHPDIELLVEKMHNKGIEVSMISNGSQPPSLYLNMFKYIKGYTFSVHFEQDYEKTLESIWATHQYVNRHNSNDCGDYKYIQVNVMMVPGYFDEAKELVEKLKQDGVPYIVRRVRPLRNKKGDIIFPKKLRDEDLSGRSKYYSEEEINYLKSLEFTVKKNSLELWETQDGTLDFSESNANDISLRNLNQFLGWKCWVGIERLHIYPNGDLYRNTCKVGGKLGNIYEGIEVPKEPVICTRDTCTCAWAINVSKAKSDSYLGKLWVGQPEV